MRTAHDSPGAPSWRRRLMRLFIGALAATIPAAYLVSTVPAAVAILAETADTIAPFELVDQFIGANFIGAKLDTSQNKIRAMTPTGTPTGAWPCCTAWLSSAPLPPRPMNRSIWSGRRAAMNTRRIRPAASV